MAAIGPSPTSTTTVAKVSTSIGAENRVGMLLVFMVGLNLAYGISWV